MVPLTGSNGLMVRLGSLIAGLNEDLAFRTATAQNRVNTIASFYGNDPTDDSPIFSALSGVQNNKAWASSLSQLAKQTVITMVNEDVTQIDSTLGTALSTLISQMLSASQTVKQNTVSASVTPTSGNAGNAVFVVSTKAPNGLILETLLAETLPAMGTNDAQSRG